jgi:L-rhamnose-H+ transport protein
MPDDVLAKLFALVDEGATIVFLEQYPEDVPGYADLEARRIPRLRNLLFSAAAGATWYFQFFFYSMGESQMGEYKFASWTLHMASIIIFSTLCGVIFKEWSGVSKRVKILVTAGISTLVFSTIIIGCANWIEEAAKAKPPTPAAAIAPAATPAAAPAAPAAPATAPTPAPAPAAK